MTEAQETALLADVQTLKSDLAALKSAPVDLTGLARKSDLPDLSSYAKKSEIPGPPDLSQYAKKSEIPVVPPAADLSPYAKTVDLTGLASKSDLTGLARKSDIPVMDMSTFVTQGDLARVAATIPTSGVTSGDPDGKVIALKTVDAIIEASYLAAGAPEMFRTSLRNILSHVK